MAHCIKFVCSIAIMYAFHSGLISPVSPAFIGFIDILLVTYGIWKFTED